MEHRTHARPELLSVINRTEILSLLRQKGPLSRAQIARELSISFPTVTANIKALMTTGLVLERGDGTNELGRKSKLLQYNARRGYVLGGDIGRKNIHIILADLVGNPLNEFAIPLDNGVLTETLLEKLDRQLDLMLKKAYIQPNHVLSICLGVPYRIDSVSRADYLNIQGSSTQLSLDRYFEQKFHVPVYVENSINLGALGEKNYGIGRGFHDIFYLDFGVGIGSALLLDDHLYRGTSGAAGEIAYCIADTSFKRTTYHDTGLLEESISQAAQDVGLVPDKNGHIQEMKPVFDRAQGGDEKATAFLDLLAGYLGVILVNTVALMNPDAVIVAGGVGTHLLERYDSFFRQTLSAHDPVIPHLLCSSLGKRASSLGAISVVLEHLNQDYTLLEHALKRSTPLISFVLEYAGKKYR